MKNFIVKLRLFVSDTQNKKAIKIVSIILCTEIVLFGVLFLIPNTAYLSQIDSQSLIELTNRERLKYNLPTLIPNETLSFAAENKAMDILQKGYFAHTNPGGKVFSEWVKEAGYEYSYAGENLALGFVTNQGVVNAWLESGKHRQNLLNSNYNEIGMAVLNGKFNNQETTIVVQIFGTKNINN